LRYERSQGISDFDESAQDGRNRRFSSRRAGVKTGAFELDFEVTLATNEQQQLLQQELNTLSDIEHITITPVEVESKAEKGVQTATEQPGYPKPSGVAAPAYIKKIQNMRIPVERLDKIMNLMGELAIAKNQAAPFFS